MIKSIACSLAGLLLVSTAMADEKKSFAQKTDVEIYGEVRAWAEVGSADNKDLSLETGDTKLGVKAKHKISPVLTGFGELSFDLNAATNTVATRYAYAGLAHKTFGKASIGKTKSIGEFIDAGDVFYTSGNQGVQKPSSKRQNSIKYVNKISDITVAVQTSATDEAANETLDLWQTAVKYEGVALTIGKDNLNSINYYGVGVTRKYGPVLVGGSYSIKDTNDSADFIDRIVFDSDKTTSVVRGYELVAGYDVDKNLTVLASFQDTDAATDDGNLTGGVHYKTHKDLVLFVETDYDLTTEDYVARTGLSFTF